MLYLKIFFFISIFIIIYTYIGYGIILWLLVRIKEAFHKRQDSHSCGVEYPEISLLIAAYNEESVVDEKMRNTNELTYPKDKLKIIWVTDGSNDRTNELLDKYENVTILYTPERKGKTAALNRAIPLLDTSFIVFTDANTMINPNAITEIAECFIKNQKVGCVAGEKRISVKEKDSAAAGGEGMYWKYESALKRLDSRLYSAVGAAGELFAIRKDLFESMSNDTLLDDFILSMRIAQKGFKIEYCDAAYAIEGGSADMKEEEKRKVRIAAGGLQSIWRLKPLLNIFRYGTLSFQYISHRVLRWSITPLLLFTLIPTNIAILAIQPNNIFYWIVLILQVLFYILGLWGYYLSTKAIKNKYLYIPYYFLFMNVNVIKGFFYLYNRKGNGAWDKSKRA